MSGRKRIPVLRGWLKTPDAAAYAGVCVPTLLSWREMGLKHSKIGHNLVLFRSSDIDEFLERFAVTAGQQDIEAEKLLKLGRQALRLVG